MPPCRAVEEFPRVILAGCENLTPELMVFYAPNVNSYKRFMSGNWAPTHDNRTALFRVVGSGKSDRNRLGLLEKHKDYVLRAKDFHKKEKSIQVLREKAAFKNPDEFYYKMINSKLVDGVHRPKVGKKYSQEETLLMKTQDIRYVLNNAQSEQKKVERLKAVLDSVGQAPTNSHVYFAEDRLEAEKIAPLAVDTEPILKKVPKRIQKTWEVNLEDGSSNQPAFPTS
ncbi:unnamed protein product [Calypogeia fissa]